MHKLYILYHELKKEYTSEMFGFPH